MRIGLLWQYETQHTQKKHNNIIAWQFWMVVVVLCVIWVLVDHIHSNERHFSSKASLPPSHLRCIHTTLYFFHVNTQNTGRWIIIIKKKNGLITALCEVVKHCEDGLGGEWDRPYRVNWEREKPLNQTPHNMSRHGIHAVNFVWVYMHAMQWKTKKGNSIEKPKRVHWNSTMDKENIRSNNNKSDMLEN